MHTLDDLIKNGIIPHIKKLIYDLKKQGLELNIDGIDIFKRDDGGLHFGQGPIQHIQVKGLEVSSIETLRGELEYNTSHAPLKTRIVYSRKLSEQEECISIQWKINYE